MSKGSFADFRDAMRAFESGFDRARYESGNIIDAQLDQWAGGPVTDFYPGYDSWGDMTDAEWDAMSYRSVNSLGFVGYQFGEALMIELGYYDDDFYYLGGDTLNRWDGTWTGKNGVESLADFMTAEKQEVAIREAFGFNLQIIDTQLGYQGLSLSDFLGQTLAFTDTDGSTELVEVTLTGLMAAAHLGGAFGAATMLLNGGASSDENGTSTLRYLREYGGYDSPSAAELIAYFEDRKTGDEGLGIGSGGGSGSGSGADAGAGGGTGTANVTKDSADVVVTWSWGSDQVVTGFDPATGTIFIDWIGAGDLDVSETGEGVVFAVPSNQQRTTLAGITLADLSAANFTILDQSAADEVLALVGSGTGMHGGDEHGDGHDDGDESHGDGGAGDTGGGDTGGGGHGGGDTGGGGHGGHMHQHVHINLGTPAQVIEGFLPAMGDVIEIEGDVTADAFAIFEESGDALGQTVRIEITQNGVTSQIVLTGFGLADLTIRNFSIANQDVLNEVAAALGDVVVTPGPGEGNTLVYDNDGSNPPQINGTTDEGGVRYRADSNADDIVGFDGTRDALDFGNTSVHGMIVTKSLAGEIVIDSPWSDAAQIVQGVTYQDVTIGTFGVVGNEHFRQDMGGVVSWEQGVGPRDSDTVYIRSHEYGVHEVIDGFDPTAMKISFLYFGTRERLSVEDAAEGLVISSVPSGQSVTLTGVTKAELIPGLVEFHFDQVMEDNLEDPFGFDQDTVTLVDRTMLLTPAAPDGASTDGFQTRTGDLTGSVYGGADGETDGDTDGQTDDGGTVGMPGSGTEIALTDGAETVTLDWSWGTTVNVGGFDPSEDVIDFHSFSDSQLAVTEAGGDLRIEVLDNGGDFTVLKGIQAEDLSASALSAPGWSAILDEDSAVIQQLVDLGFDLMA